MPIFRLLYVLIMYLIFLPVNFFLTMVVVAWEWNFNELRRFKKESVLTSTNYETGHYWGYKNPIDFMLRRNGVEVKNREQEIMDDFIESYKQNP